MHERQTELFCEWGSRWLDLKRTGTATAVLGTLKPGWKATDVLYPVPNPQLQVDNLLTQNPGYN
jgi:starch-binding outer membrane protein, SusD/RagB family